MTPSWPQVAGWLATSTVTTASGRVRGPEVGIAADAATADCLWFAVDGERLELRWPDGRRYADDGTRAVLTAPDGRAELAPSDDTAFAVRELLHPRPLGADDYHRAAGPPRSATVAGRLGWAVDLIAPPRKSGHWQIVVDDETGCLLRSAHDQLGPNAEIVALDLAAPDTDFGYDGPEPVDPLAAGKHEATLFAAGAGPTVRQVPGGYGGPVVHAEGDRVLVELDTQPPQTPRVSVAPLGSEPLDPGPFYPYHRTRPIDHHVWLLATPEPLTDDDADRMLDSATWIPPVT